MNFFDVLKKRRAVREYTQAPIERAEVEAVINAAIEAPSAMNLQPWAFAVILGRENVDRCAKRAKDWLVGHMMELSSAAQHRLEQRISGDPEFTLFYHAPALVLVLATTPEPQATEDCCLAAENLMLAARDRNLGTCWIGFARPWLNSQDIKAELGIPEQYHIVAPIVVGHPIAWPESHGRKPPEVHWVRPLEVEQPRLAGVH